MATGEEKSPKRGNRLAQEKSPYLLQHASNPVDWYPWGEEAFEKSRRENKPIFLSVGYSTCHWCHVMERESFENQEIAKILLDHFVSIKVDREERPDVDKVYMTFVQATQRGGGWPMSVFLTPELKPFIGGTYFPPEDHFQRPGFRTILRSIAEQWERNSEEIRHKSAKVMKALEEIVCVTKSEDGDGPPGCSCVQRAHQTLAAREDKKYGGFASAPKFPQPVILGFLLNFYARYIGADMGEDALKIVVSCLRSMSKGGIHDHVGQGFHRYSTDEEWHIPHFEKMLYDQAQLVCVYLDAYQITKEDEFAEIARDILLYISRDLTDEDGGFYAAEDADSFQSLSSEHKTEGAFCVWTHNEISSQLSSRLPSPSPSACLTLGDLFSYHYGVNPDGNVPGHKDPHGELGGKNVLIVRGSLKETAEHFKLPIPLTTELLSKAREELAQVRMGRPKPQRDNKIVTSWNGLTISAFARAYQVLGVERYLKIALRAAEFIQTNHYCNSSRRFQRNSYRENNGILTVKCCEGFADDYSFLIQGLLDLYEASQDQQWFEWAWQLQETQNDLFWDKDGDGGYFSSTSHDPSILLRVKEDQDGSEPSPNSVSASNLHRFSLYMNRKLQPSATDIYSIFRDMLTRTPAALCGMLRSFLWQKQSPKQIIIAGEMEAEDTKSLLRVVHSFYIPNRVLIVHSPNSSTSFLSHHIPSLEKMVSENGCATAYVCENFTCLSPTCDPEKLKGLIDPTKHLKV